MYPAGTTDPYEKELFTQKEESLKKRFRLLRSEWGPRPGGRRSWSVFLIELCEKIDELSRERAKKVESIADPTVDEILDFHAPLNRIGHELDHDGRIYFLETLAELAECYPEFHEVVPDPEEIEEWLALGYFYRSPRFCWDLEDKPQDSS